MNMQEKLQNIATAWIETLWRDFIDTKVNRGPNFSLEKFPDMAARIARASAFTSFSEGEYKEEFGDFIYEKVKEGIQARLKEL